ncbi:MAG: A24 family peptidase [Brevinematales bacterium]|nr:A24 family peptidase [Brevinematales bacterium]
MEIVQIVFNSVILVILSAFDIKTRTVPNYITVPYILLGFLFIILFPDNCLNLMNTFEFLIIVLVMFIYSKLRNFDFFDVFGGGDIKVVFGLSLMSSFEIFNISLIFGSLLGMLWGIVKRRKGIPFIPFLFLGYLVGVIWYVLYNYVI